MVERSRWQLHTIWHMTTSSPVSSVTHTHSLMRFTCVSQWSQVNSHCCIGITYTGNVYPEYRSCYFHHYFIKFTQHFVANIIRTVLTRRHIWTIQMYQIQFQLGLHLRPHFGAHGAPRNDRTYHGRYTSKTEGDVEIRRHVLLVKPVWSDDIRHHHHSTEAVISQYYCNVLHTWQVNSETSVCRQSIALVLTILGRWGV